MKVLRKVDFKIPRTIESSNDFDYLTADPELEDYQKNNVESKLLEVDELTNGEVFGEFACILKEKIQYTALTAIPTEVIIVERTNFIPLGKEKVEFFLGHSKLIPTDIDLRKAIIEGFRWAYFKDQVTQSVKA
jgi:hypothetical protein